MNTRQVTWRNLGGLQILHSISPAGRLRRVLHGALGNRHRGNNVPISATQSIIVKASKHVKRKARVYKWNRVDTNMGNYADLESHTTTVPGDTSTYTFWNTKRYRSSYPPGPGPQPPPVTILMTSLGVKASHPPHRFLWENARETSNLFAWPNGLRKGKTSCKSN